MEFYTKEDGYPMSISIETMSVDKMDDDTCLYSSIVMDMETDKVIAEFCHDSLLGRRKWAEGFFAALKFKEQQETQNIQGLGEMALQYIKEIWGETWVYEKWEVGQVIEAMCEFRKVKQPKQVTDEMEDKLAELYLKDYVCIAEVCDEILDRSGGLLGRIRNKARIKRNDLSIKK